MAEPENPWYVRLKEWIDSFLMPSDTPKPKATPQAPAKLAAEQEQYLRDLNDENWQDNLAWIAAEKERQRRERMNQILPDSGVQKDSLQ